jgi:hypothetical protein
MKREEILGALGHLRRGLLLMVLVVIGWGILLYPFSKSVLRYLQITLQENLVAFGIPEAFLSLLKLTLYGSLFLSVRSSSIRFGNLSPLWSIRRD